MSVFTPEEIAYLRGQRLGRLATVNASGDPHVVPVGFRYNPEHDVIEIGGHNFGKSKKFRDMQRDTRIAFVVDDVLPPWQPRGIEVRGHAEILRLGGKDIRPGFDDEIIRIRPQRVISWGIEGDAYHANTRAVDK